MRVRSRFLALVCGLGVGVAVGCNGAGGGGDDDGTDDGSGDGGALGDAYLGKLDSCGLLSDGELPMVDDSAFEGQDGCLLECLLDASCDDVVIAICEPPDPQPSEQITACIESCQAQGDEGGEDFQCADGNGSTPEASVCDGQSDCADGSDEQGCPTYACADGEIAVDGVRCNFNQDCADGSDEQGCAQIVCPNP